MKTNKTGLKNFIYWFLIILPVIVQVSRIVFGKFGVNLIEPDYFSIYFLLWAITASILLIARYKIKPLIMVCIFAMFLLMVEIGFLLQNTVFYKKTVYKFTVPITVQDDLLCYKLSPGITSLGTKTIGGETVYKNMEIIVDNKSRRTLKQPFQNGEQHALFFGASFMFGEGCDANDILPHQFELNSKGKYKSYNYAVGGWGCGQMLIQLRNKKLFDDVEPKKGIAVYAFIGDHVLRSTGKSSFHKNYETYPYFDLNEKGILEGPFLWKEHQPWRKYIKTIIRLRQASPVFSFFSSRDYFHPVTNEKAIAIGVEIIDESRQLYQKMFDGEFIVMIWPRQKLKTEAQHQYFMKLLKEKGIKSFVVPEMADRSKAVLHKYDSHPSVAENKWVAEHLWKFLQKEEK